MRNEKRSYIMQWCFNEHRDVPLDIKLFLENASGQPLKKLTIEDINSFLTGYDEHNSNVLQNQHKI